MKTYQFAACASLLVLTLPLSADPATPAAAQPAIGQPASIPAAQPVLDKLIGKQEALGLTLRGGSPFLGRIVSGDHGSYVVQTFHYVSSTTTVSEKVTVPRLTGSRYRQHYTQSTRTEKVQTLPEVIPDGEAVRALLSGVTGPTYRPHEEEGPRQIISPSDIVCIQELRPPGAKPLGASSLSAWTMKTLWASPAPASPKPATSRTSSNPLSSK